MSLVQILSLVKHKAESQDFGPHLLKLSFGLLIEMAEFCIKSDVRIHKSISAFETTTNDWHIAAM